MKSALKKSVVSTSISLILASGMAAFAAHAADDVKLKATKTNVAFSDFTPTEYSTKGKPNIIVLTMDDLGYGQLPFDKESFDPKTMENREVVDTYKIGIDKAIEAAQKSTPTLLSLMDEGVRFTNGYVAHGVSGPSRAAIMTGRAPARFGVYSNTDAQDGIPLTETFLPELFQNHGYYTAAVGKWHLSKISNVPVPEDKQTRDYHDNFTTFSAEEWQPQNRGFDYFMGFHAAGTAYYNSPSLFKNRERVPAKGYISDQL
ncbi:TPA: sulfatase-like hydrolase/transferase, partial [Escherichia coli]